MFKKALPLLLFCMSCFRPSLNQNALLHQRSCIESIEQLDYGRAKLHCELCLEYDSSMPECLNGIGLIAFIEKDQEKAISFFTKALRQDNDFSHARNNLGVIYFSNGDFSEARNYFARALEIDPSNLDARYNLGLSYLRLGQTSLAKKDAKLGKRHLEKAQDQIRKLLAIEPTFLGAYRDLGLVALHLYEQSELKDGELLHLASAKSAFSSCLEQSPDAGCYEGLGQVYFYEGRFDKAFENYFSCLAYEENNSACKSGIVLAYEKSVQASIGYQQFTTLVSADKQNAQAHQAFCFALFERGLDVEALKQCEQALRLKPDLCATQYRLAEYYTSIASSKAAKYCQSFLICGQNQAGNEITKCQEILTAVKR